MSDFWQTVAALAEVGVGLALLIGLMSKSLYEAVFKENTLPKRAWWMWVCCFGFATIVTLTIEVVFHTLQVPLN